MTAQTIEFARTDNLSQGFETLDAENRDFWAYEIVAKPQHFDFFPMPNGDCIYVEKDPHVRGEYRSVLYLHTA